LTGDGAAFARKREKGAREKGERLDKAQQQCEACYKDDVSARLQVSSAASPANARVAIRSTSDVYLVSALPSE